MFGFYAWYCDQYENIEAFTESGVIVSPEIFYWCVGRGSFHTTRGHGIRRNVGLQINAPQMHTARIYCVTGYGKIVATHHWSAEGIASRRRHRLVRRVYMNLGPNYLWHIDGYDKLKPYGICISGAIDGFSRYILWLEAHVSNSDPRVIAGYFMNTVRQLRWQKMISPSNWPF